MGKRLINPVVNGRKTPLMVDDRMTLLEALRESAGMTGTKEGCLTGDCGACSVIVDGGLVDSCLVMAAEAETACIETVEGMSKGPKLHPLQAEFLKSAGLQCGICTPGFLVAAKALLEQNPNPSEQEVKYFLAGNLCRCTGYQQIMVAIQAAAKTLRKDANAAD